MGNVYCEKAIQGLKKKKNFLYWNQLFIPFSSFHFPWLFFFFKYPCIFFTFRHLLNSSGEEECCVHLFPPFPVFSHDAPLTLAWDPVQPLGGGVVHATWQGMEGSTSQSSVLAFCRFQKISCLPVRGEACFWSLWSLRDWRACGSHSQYSTPFWQPCRRATQEAPGTSAL